MYSRNKDNRRIGCSRIKPRSPRKLINTDDAARAGNKPDDNQIAKAKELLQQMKDKNQPIETTLGQIEAMSLPDIRQFCNYCRDVLFRLPRK